MARPARPRRRCTGPGPCTHMERAKGLCVGHLGQFYRKQPLRPLGERRAVRRVTLWMRVELATKARALADPEGVRSAVEEWAKG